MKCLQGLVLVCIALSWTGVAGAAKTVVASANISDHDNCRPLLSLESWPSKKGLTRGTIQKLVDLKKVHKILMPFQDLLRLVDYRTNPQLEIFPSDFSGNFLGKEALKYFSRHEYQIDAFPEGVKLFVVPELGHYGSFRPLRWSVQLSSDIFDDLALVKSTLDHENVHAKLYAEWANAEGLPDAINTEISGDLPNSEEEDTILQEVPAYEASFWSYLRYSKENNLAIDKDELEANFEKMEANAQIFIDAVSPVLRNIKTRRDFGDFDTFKKNSDGWEIWLPASKQKFEFTLQEAEDRLTPFPEVSARIYVTTYMQNNEFKEYQMNIPLLVGKISKTGNAHEFGYSAEAYFSKVIYQLEEILRIANEGLSEANRLRELVPSLIEEPNAASDANNTSLAAPAP